MWLSCLTKPRLRMRNCGQLGIFNTSKVGNKKLERFPQNVSVHFCVPLEYVCQIWKTMALLCQFPSGQRYTEEVHIQCPGQTHTHLYLHESFQTVAACLEQLSCVEDCKGNLLHGPLTQYSCIFLPSDKTFQRISNIFVFRTFKKASSLEKKLCQIITQCSG